MKNLVIAVLSVVSISLSAQAAEILSDAQVAHIALITVHSDFSRDDIISVIRYDIEPDYQVQILRLTKNAYDIVVRRMQPGNTCQQDLSINSTSGKVTKGKLVCE